MRYAVAFLLAIAGGVACAEESIGIPDDIIKELDSLVGTWDAKGTVGDMTETGRFTCRWSEDMDGKKICLIGRFVYRSVDAKRTGTTLIGWNALEECIEDRGFTSNGGSGRLLWTVESPGEWKGDLSFIRDGKEEKSTAILIVKGTTDKGEPSRYSFRRVEPKADR